MTDFTNVSDSLEESTTFAVDTIRLGDGFSQAIPSGINNGLRQWNVSFSDRSLTEANAIVAFFQARFGATSFTWRPQGFTADVKVRCGTYSRPIQNRFLAGAFVYTVTATFTEVPL